MSLAVVISIILSATLLSLAGLHVYWAFGGVSATSVAIPQTRGKPLFSPARATTLLVAAGLFLAAAVAAARGGAFWPAGEHVAVRGAAIVIGLLFAARAIGDRNYVGMFKRVKGTPFARWDTRLFTPLCVAIAAGFLALWYLT